MGIVTQPAEKMAKSACTHSARLAERTPTAAPRFRPSAVASSRAASPTSRHVSVSHFPPRLRCWAGLSALRSTRSQNIVASVFSAMARPPSDPSAELPAKGLPHLAPGPGAHDPHLLGTLVPRRPRLAEGHALLGRGARPPLQHHERQHVLAH